MGQTHEAKLSAIKALLPLIFAHRDLIPGGAKTARQGWESERSPLDGPPAPPPTWNLGCDGHCDQCRLRERLTGKPTKCPPEEPWLRAYRYVRTRYRIPELETALMDLSQEDPTMAQAVWAVWVEPWPGEPFDREHPEEGFRGEPISDTARLYRMELALEGVEWLADYLPGNIAAPGDDRPTKEQQCEALLKDGITSPKEIAQRLGVCYSHAKRLKRTAMVRCQSAPYAVGG